MDWMYIEWAAMLGGVLIGYVLCMCTVIITMLWDGRLRKKRKAARALGMERW